MTTSAIHEQQFTSTAPLEQGMIVGTFGTHDQAERTVRQLLDAGLPAPQISFVTQGLEAREDVLGYVTTGDGARKGAGMGAWVGGIFGLFTGAAFIWIPVIGPLIVLGALASAVVGALEGGAAGGLLGAIWGRYMGQEHVLLYQEALRGGKLIVTVHGTPQEMESARRVMGQTDGHDVNTYSAAR